VFQRTLIQILGGAISAIVALPAAAYLLLQPKQSRTDDMVEIADLDELAVGTPQEVVYFRTRVDGWKRTREKTTAWVVKTADQTAVAFSPQCPHLGCIYHWEAERFECPCHASAFSAQGEVLGGPAPRPLDRYVTRIEGSMLLASSEIKKS
jgi:menaquinol-cytochrome c reductase iron-sulfur subunit